MFAQSIFVWCMSWNMWKLHFILWRHSYSFGLWIFYLVGSLHLIQCIGGKKLLVGRQLLGGLGNNFSGLLSTSHEITCSNPLFQVSVFLHCCSFLFIYYLFIFFYNLLKYYFYSYNCRKFSFGSHAIFFEILYCLDGW